MLHIEVGVLKAANAAKAKHICELIDYGSSKPDYVFVVMTLLFKDLHKLRSEMPDRRFGLSTSLRLSMQALRSGNVIPARKDIGWRGTTRYGSLTAHMRQDLGRRDDLESWFYMTVEMTRGTLPWRLVTDRAAVQAAKQAARAAGRIQFLFETPKQFDQILTMVDSYVFDSVPDYDKIYKILDEAREEKGIRMTEHWDWEEETSCSITTNTMNSLSEHDIKAKKE
ncbi:hypothetical protein OESDEN_17429 [Oesophagostomum dentatum]|uniref:Protein kinase domain-containing protein n=1 Tax=Oesophagostomum dentatum TaxID=61180 RepID=A0A0B1SG46_OESDE|nr:hypothetical protein OESDEN_17429 [Oesophagostomum dentatum]